MNPSKFFERLYATNEPFCHIVITNKDFVDWALEHNTHNRPVSKTTVNAYRRDMEAGNWGLIPNGIGFTKDGVLIDGQHRLIANKEAGYPPVQMVVVGGLELDAQKAIDQHNKRSFVAVCKIAFDMALSTTGAGTLRNIAMFERNRPSRPEDFAERLFRPTTAELAECVNLYKDEEMMPSANHGERGLTAGYWSVLLYCAKHGADREKIKDFAQRCKSGNGLSSREPARTWRRIFIENNPPIVNGRRIIINGAASIKYTAILLFKHLGIDHLEIDSSNSAQEGAPHA